jgi:hypothetical protein
LRRDRDVPGLEGVVEDIKGKAKEAEAASARGGAKAAEQRQKSNQ